MSIFFALQSGGCRNRLALRSQEKSLPLQSNFLTNSRICSATSTFTCHRLRLILTTKNGQVTPSAHSPPFWQDKKIVKYCLNFGQIAKLPHVKQTRTPKSHKKKSHYKFPLNMYVWSWRRRKVFAIFSEFVLNTNLLCFKRCHVIIYVVQGNDQNMWYGVFVWIF